MPKNKTKLAVSLLQISVDSPPNQSLPVGCTPPRNRPPAGYIPPRDWLPIGCTPPRNRPLTGCIPPTALTPTGRPHKRKCRRANPFSMEMGSPSSYLDPPESISPSQELLIDALVGQINKKTLNEELKSYINQLMSMSRASIDGLDDSSDYIDPAMNSPERSIVEDVVRLSELSREYAEQVSHMVDVIEEVQPQLEASPQHLLHSPRDVTICPPSPRPVPPPSPIMDPTTRMQRPSGRTARGTSHSGRTPVRGQPPSGRPPRGQTSSGRTPRSQHPSRTTPIRGPSPSGIIPRGQTPSGRTPRGQYPSRTTPIRGPSPSGITPRGQTPSGRTPRDQTASGRTPRGQFPSRTTQIRGPPPSGITPRGQTPSGRTPRDQTASGIIPRGQTPTGRTPRGQTSSGRTPTGQTSSGRTPIRGQTPSGRTPRDPPPSGRTPTDPSPSGRTPRGPSPSSQPPGSDVSRIPTSPQYQQQGIQTPFGLSANLLSFPEDLPPRTPMVPRGQQPVTQGYAPAMPAITESSPESRRAPMSPQRSPGAQNTGVGYGYPQTDPNDFANQRFTDELASQPFDGLPNEPFADDFANQLFTGDVASQPFGGLPNQPFTDDIANQQFTDELASQPFDGLPNQPFADDIANQQFAGDVASQPFDGLPNQPFGDDFANQQFAGEFPSQQFNEADLEWDNVNQLLEESAPSSGHVTYPSDFPPATDVYGPGFDWEAANLTSPPWPHSFPGQELGGTALSDSSDIKIESTFDTDAIQYPIDINRINNIRTQLSRICNDQYREVIEMLQKDKARDLDEFDNLLKRVRSDPFQDPDATLAPIGYRDPSSQRASPIREQSSNINNIEAIEILSNSIRQQTLPPEDISSPQINFETVD